MYVVVDQNKTWNTTLITGQPPHTQPWRPHGRLKHQDEVQLTHSVAQGALLHLLQEAA